MSELHEMNEHLQSIDNRLNRHIGVVEVILKNQQNYMESIEVRQKEQSKEFVDAIATITSSFDSKLDNHRESVADESDKRRHEITAAVERMEKKFDKRIEDTEGKARLIAWVAAAIMGTLTTAIGLVLTAIKVLGGT